MDDQRDSVELLCFALEHMGHEVRAASTGNEALDATLAFKPQLVFLDISLPDVDGYEVARRIRADPNCARVFLAALTGWARAEDAERAMVAGFDTHVAKPANRKSLLRVVETAIARVESLVEET